MLLKKFGLLRRVAPRNDGVDAGRQHHIGR
jgi:hypothetical protein